MYIFARSFLSQPQKEWYLASEGMPVITIAVLHFVLSIFVCKANSRTNYRAGSMRLT